jgi:hypothetical protein
VAAVVRYGVMKEVTTDPALSRSPSASACLPFHELTLTEAGLAKGRNALPSA